VLQVVAEFLEWLAKRFVSPVKPTRRAAQGKAGSSSKADEQQLLHVALDSPGESSTSSWCRQHGIDEDFVLQQLIHMINVSGRRHAQQTTNSASACYAKA
jgi:hypothetical protein